MAEPRLLTRPDGVEIAVERRGRGPVVLFTLPFFSPPSVYEGLIADLARDHTVVIYHPRGCGDSTRRSPYDAATDTADFAAVARAEGRVAVTIGLGYGLNCALRAFAEDPGVVEHIFTPAGQPLGRAGVQGSEGLAGSDSVVDMMLALARTDYRAFLRTIISSANPQLDEEVVRERVDEQAAFGDRDAVVERAQLWINEDVTPLAQAAGSALSLNYHPNNVWFAHDVVPRMRATFPDAQIAEVADGPLSRPDLASAVVRALTRGA